MSFAAASSCRLKEEELMKRIDEVIVKTIIAAEPALGKCRLPAHLPACFGARGPRVFACACCRSGVHDAGARGSDQRV